LLNGLLKQLQLYRLLVELKVKNVASLVKLSYAPVLAIVLLLMVRENNKAYTLLSGPKEERELNVATKYI